MKTLFLDVKNEKVGVVMDIEPSLETYYRLLDCDLIEMPVRYVEGREFTIICDEEGLLKDSPKISAIDRQGKIMFVGNLLFLHIDDEGEEVGLTDEDIEHLKRNIYHICTNSYPEGYWMLANCEFYND